MHVHAIQIRASQVICGCYTEVQSRNMCTWRDVYTQQKALRTVISVRMYSIQDTHTHTYIHLFIYMTDHELPVRMCAGSAWSLVLIVSIGCPAIGLTAP